jgi:hypothetical protein
MGLERVIMKKFLRRLLNLNIWGGRHTELKHLSQALPSHLRGSKESKNALKELTNREFIFVKMSTGEKHVSLNSHKRREIYEFMESSNDK